LVPIRYGCPRLSIIYRILENKFLNSYAVNG